MSKHLKTIVIDRLKSTIATFVDLPAGTPHARGVYYFRADAGIDCLWDAMDYASEGQKYKKHIIVRPSRFRNGLFELYTCHFPTRWSAACVANRELIKEAQRQAHALEHDHSLQGLEWRFRFFRHYFTIVKGGAKPEPGLKPYSRFYQYVYVLIYRQLRVQAQEQLQETKTQELRQESSCISVPYLGQPTTPVTFEPITPALYRSAYTRRRIYPHMRWIAPPAPTDEPTRIVQT